MPPKSELSAFLVALGMLLSPEPTALPLHSLSIKISVSCRFEVGTSGLGKKDSHSVLGFEMRLEFPVLGARKTVGLSPEHKVLIVGHGLLEHFVWVISNKGIRTCKALKCERNALTRLLSGKTQPDRAATQPTMMLANKQPGNIRKLRGRQRALLRGYTSSPRETCQNSVSWTRKRKPCSMPRHAEALLCKAEEVAHGELHQLELTAPRQELRVV